MSRLRLWLDMQMHATPISPDDEKHTGPLLSRAEVRALLERLSPAPWPVDGIFHCDRCGWTGRGTDGCGTHACVGGRPGELWLPSSVAQPGAGAELASRAEDAERRQALLSAALLSVLKSVGMIRPDVVTSGPELLLAAETFVGPFAGRRRESVSCEQCGGPVPCHGGAH